MSKYYDIHCHVFNKDMLVRRLVNVVQTLLEITDSRDDIGASNHKLKSIIDNLKVVSQDSSEDVFNVLNDVYQGKFIVTPLMLDLTFADDNDGNVIQDINYRRRIKRIFKLIRVLLIVAKRKIKTDENKDLIDSLRGYVKEFDRKFEMISRDNIEIFDNVNYEQQLVDLEFLAENYDNVKPFYCVDPRRKDYESGMNIIDTLKDRILGDNAKFYGVKLYAPVGFSPTDPVLMGTNDQLGVYDFCMQHDIPITVHCSNSGFACLSKNLEINGDIYLKGAVINWPEKKYTFDHNFFGLKAGEAISERASILNHPRLWEVVLQKYPKLTINLAHFGGSSQLMDYVHYKIHIDKVDIDDYEELVSQVSPDLQDIIHSSYTKKRRKMILKTGLSVNKQRELWNALYHAKLIDNWAKTIFDLVKNPDYPNAYVDLSCFSKGEILNLPDDDTDDKIFTIKNTLNNFKISFYDKLSDYEKSKILYGSDYFLLQFFGIEMKQYLSDFKEVFGTEFEKIASINSESFLSIND